MKNVTKKLLSISLAVCCGLSTLSIVACGPNDSGKDNPNKKPTDEDVSTISIGVFNGDFGYEWANHVASDFAKYYKDYLQAFEEILVKLLICIIRQIMLAQ